MYNTIMVQCKVIEQVPLTISVYRCRLLYEEVWVIKKSSLIDILKVVLLFWSFVLSRSFQGFSKE
jgi:hypothetical protein